MRKAQIVLQIHKDLLAGKLELPALPKIALKVKEVAADPDSDIFRLSLVAQSDPAFCGYLIEVSNSPLFRGSQAIKSVLNAINRVGLEGVKKLALSYAIKAVFSVENKALAKYLKSVWQQTTYTSSLAQVMARRSKTIDPEQALLAGLLQNIGELPLLFKALNYPDLMKSPKGLLALQNHYAGNIGACVLKQWQLEPEFINVTRNRNNWMRQHNGPADITDLLILARLHSFVGTPHMRKLPRLNQIPAFAKLDLGELGPKESFEFIEEAKDEIKQIQIALGGGKARATAI
jgi:HD-like signal output (HDOD) protein